MYSTVNEIGEQTIQQGAFLGLNYNEEINQGEFSEAVNVSNEQYPTLKVREPFTKWTTTFTSGQDIQTFGENYLVLANHNLYQNSYVTPLNPTQFDTTKTQYIVRMGAYAIVMPDGFYVNTEKTTDKGYIERSYNTGATSTTFTLCKQDGTAYATPTVSATAPDNPSNADLWIDTTQTPHVLNQYSQQEDVWTQIPTVYCKIAHTGIGSGLKMYDSVEISGITASGSPIQDQLTFMNGTMIVYDCGTDYIVVAAIIDQTATLTDDIHVDMTMPKMDFVIESGNRLWGCKYGIVNNEPINEIYASKLGDFRNWRNYMGLSTDSYAVSIGTDGAWTGAINYLGYPLFFKENVCHKIYGSAPSNYQVQNTSLRGVKDNCSRSLVIIDERLYYMSEDGVMVYDGSLPQKISGALGLKKWGHANFGAVNGLLHCSVKDENANTRYIFTYDPKRNAWLRHTYNYNTVMRYAEVNGVGCFINESGDIWTMKNVTGATHESVTWSVRSGRLLYGDDKNTMKLLKVTMRMRVENMAYVRVMVEYDDDGIWHQQKEFRASKLGTYVLPIFIKKCDHLRIKLEGEGEMTLFAINQVYTEGANR